GIRDFHVTGVQTCALPIYESRQGVAAVQGTRIAIIHSDRSSGQAVPIFGAKLATVAEVTVTARNAGRGGMNYSGVRITRITCARSEERRVGKEAKRRGVS